MPKRKVVVCRSKSAADVQRELLKKDGYEIKVAPKECSAVIWDDTDAGGNGAIRSNVWLVEGEQ
jgi:hypothetical protein